MSALPAIGFLHTAAVHEPTFANLAAELAPETETIAVVDERLLSDARERGAEAPTVTTVIEMHLDELERQGAGVVVCTCSTIGGAAEMVGEGLGSTIIRVDRPMAEAAVAYRRIGLVAAVESTLEPSRQLLEQVAEARGTSIALTERLVAGAWQRFEIGGTAGYIRLVVEACEALALRCDVIVLAQASMAQAAERVDATIPVLSSPRLAVRAAVAALDTVS